MVPTFHLSYYLLLLMVFTIPWENSVVFDGLGTIVRPIGSLAFIMTLLHLFKTGIYRPLNSIHYLLLAFVVWSAVSVLWSVDPELTFIRIKTYAQLFVMIWLIWELIQTDQQMRVLLQTYILGAYVSIANTFSKFLDTEQVNYGRYAAEGFDPNDLGVILALGIPMAWYLLIVQKTFILKWLNAAYILLGMLAIIMTASRTAFAVAILGLFYIALIYGRLSHRTKILVIVFIMISLFWGLKVIPNGAFDRILTIQEEVNSGSLSGRGELWFAGLEMVNEQPLLGVGAGAYPAALEEFLGTRELSHNTLLSVIAETGVIGLILFLTVLFISFYTACQTSYLEATLFFVLLTIWLLASMFLTWELRKPTWLLFALIALEHSKVQSKKNSLNTSSQKGKDYLSITSGLSIK
ncbi:O-antigen ligase family protein [Bacillus sp. FJAT-52991]|uniref:O-antigen ligase family protein n=1 Tax=Bacillus kandeliae TaxID=3129297 RepID=A0ABZ2N6Y0_9BACI